MTFLDRSGRRPWARLPLATALSALALAAATDAEADPRLRYQIDQRGDMLLIGNTIGFDCRPGIPRPIVGNVDLANCGTNIEDSSADVWWRDEAETGSATASVSVKPPEARSTAFLKLPDGAKVTYARLYWAGSHEESSPPDGKAVLERPGQPLMMIVAGTVDTDRSYTGGKSYQSSADVTGFLQQHGSGAYRVTGVPRMQAVNTNSDVNYAVWSLVVFYQKDGMPIRNLTLWDGLTGVIGGTKASVNLAGFRVPVGVKVEAKLGLIAYEGDHDYDGDSLTFNGTRLVDGTTGSDNNFFNSSRTYLGQVQTQPGDLPQMSGEPGSMVGLDLDVVDISPYLKANDTQATLSIESTKEDIVLLGAMATSINSTKPVIETILTYPQGTSTKPGDVIELTSTTRNIGDAPGGDLIIEQKLPPGLTYVPDSVRMYVPTDTGINGGKTDKPGDDQVEWDPLTGTLRIRIGKGATSTKGGTIDPGDAPVIVKYQVRIDDRATGDLPIQSTTTATPVGGVNSGPIPFPSGNGVTPNAPTIVVVPPCVSNDDCSPGAPVCDKKNGAPHCTDVCDSDVDCQGTPGGTEVCSTAKKCVQCSAGTSAACVASGPGNQCITPGFCGCNTDADCGGRTCDVVTHLCPKPDIDLSVTVQHEPQAPRQDTPLVYAVTAKNQSTVADAGPVRVTFEVDRGGVVDKLNAQPGWRCSLLDQKVSCLRYRPLQPGESAQVVTVTVVPSPTAVSDPPTVTIKATVASDSSTDPSPGDNTVIETTELGILRVAGGGLGCSTSQSGSASGLSALATAALLSLLGVLRLRRRSKSSH